ncbi:hypothetical protein [Pasteurella testudinis]|uniref:hypothetical protein n=1 Tax=Pasteurella testudinis TaxID=761 RepID=UPI0040583EB3
MMKTRLRNMILQDIQLLLAQPLWVTIHLLLHLCYSVVCFFAFVGFLTWGVSISAIGIAGIDAEVFTQIRQMSFMMALIYVLGLPLVTVWRNIYRTLK